MIPADSERWQVRAVATSLVCVALTSTDLATKTFASRVSGIPLVDPLANDRLMLGLGDLSTPWVIALSTLLMAASTTGTVALMRAGLLGWWVLPLGAAGFLGNAIDRLVLGHVRDWLVVGPTRWNLADLFLLVAITMVVAAGIASVRSGQPDSNSEHVEGVKQL